jgi:hypothetical protein
MPVLKNTSIRFFKRFSPAVHSRVKIKCIGHLFRYGQLLMHICAEPKIWFYICSNMCKTYNEDSEYEVTNVFYK